MPVELLRIPSEMASIIAFPFRGEGMRESGPLERDTITVTAGEHIERLDTGVELLYTNAGLGEKLDFGRGKTIVYASQDYFYAYKGRDVQGKPSERVRTLRIISKAHPLATAIFEATKKGESPVWAETVELVAFEGQVGQHALSDSRIAYKRETPSLQKVTGRKPLWDESNTQNAADLVKDTTTFSFLSVVK
jgi:hypothetical protein